MNKIKSSIKIALAILILWNTSLKAQDKPATVKEGYKFTTVKEIPVTCTKNQNKSGTCWSFSTLSFIESEVLRKSNIDVDLSEMFVVWHTYSDKATKYVRMHGNLTFAAGGSSEDVINCMEKYGMVPDEVFKGLNYGEDKHVHDEMDAVLKGIVAAVGNDNSKKLTTAWHSAFDNAMSAYLGTPPAKFDYKGKSYTPQSFMNEYLKINPFEYISLTSYTHHPFYQKFAIEVPDNWGWDESYNVPLDEMIKTIDNAIENGYTVAWGADISEKGFSAKNGVAVLPEVDLNSMAGTEKEKWEKMTDKEREAEMYKFDKPLPEKVVTQESRQKGFDNYQTTDDHGMQIFGIAKDQNGNKYYMVKNSWGTDYNDYKGTIYFSEAFVKAKTMSFMIHKDALPKDISKKLNIN